MGRKRQSLAKSASPKSPNSRGSAQSRHRVFSGIRSASPSKRERVESAAKELGYVPTRRACAGLAPHRVIGVLIPSLTNNVFSDVLRGIYDASEGSRYSIQLANTRYTILQEEQLLRLFQGPEAGRTDRDRHRPDRGIPRSHGEHQLPNRAGDHGNGTRPSGRHDGRFFTSGCRFPRGLPPALLRRGFSASDRTARKWIRACSNGWGGIRVP